MKQKNRRQLVSIIVPIKDRTYINQLKNNLSNQTFKNFEFIVMNSDEPVAKKRNEGVKKAKGEYIVFIDDVILPPSWLEELLRYARKDIPVVGSIMKYWKFGEQKHATTCNCIFYKKYSNHLMNHLSMLLTKIKTGFIEWVE